MSIETVVTGLAWMGTGIRSVRSALKDLLREAKSEIMFCAYSVTGGADEILEEFDECLKRGIRLRAVINRFSQQPESIRLYLKGLSVKYPYCHIYSFDDPEEELHAKLIIIDRQTALIGSANLSMRGMQKNYEIGVILRDQEVLNISRCFEELLLFPSVSVL